MGWLDRLRQKIDQAEERLEPANPVEDLLQTAFSTEEGPEVYLARFEVLGLFARLGESQSAFLRAELAASNTGPKRPWWWSCRQLSEVAGAAWPLRVLNDPGTPEKSTKARFFNETTAILVKFTRILAKPTGMCVAFIEILVNL